MRSINLAVLIGIVISAGQANAQILPKNKLHLQDRLNAGNMTEQQFNQITDTIVEMWQPIAKKMGANLSAEKDWKDSTVNAYANQQGKNWIVHMFGGLARRPEVTLDGFALVVCHELGHHFGGYYFYGDGEWAASEGEADYWATQVCAKEIWKKLKMRGSTAFLKKLNAHQAAKIAVAKDCDQFSMSAAERRQCYHSAKGGLLAYVAKVCDNVWNNETERAFCYRSVDGGLSLAKLLGALGGEPEPSIDTPDQSRVSRTVVSHPHAQCRLDTYVSGALCSSSYDVNVIPGKGSNGGSNSAVAEKAAAQSSCMSVSPKPYEIGLRPRCWFKPQLGNDNLIGRRFRG